MANARQKPLSVEEFLEWEERQELRHEFDGVRSTAMTGGTDAHAAILQDGRVHIRGHLRGVAARCHGAPPRCCRLREAKSIQSR